MAEERPQPLQPFSEIQNEVRRLFQELIHQPWESHRVSTATDWQPRCDMAETDAAIIVEVELPGVERDNVRIEVDGDVLRISGERQATVEHRERQYYPTWNRAMDILSGSCHCLPLLTVKGSAPSSRRAF
jgi:HSP20 family protein